VQAERAVLAGLGGGCQLPVGAYARLEDDTLKVSAVVVALEGALMLRSHTSGRPHEAEHLGRWVAEDLLWQGAEDLLGSGA
jgi:hydroxymethylbilane synthase